MKIRAKLVSVFLGVNLVSAVVGGLVMWQITEKVAERVGARYQSTATDLLDKIDRNLFERYGDVQAFGLNTVVQDKEQWYKPPAENRIAAVMNKYVAAYGMYSITLMVDLDGKVVAVNNKGADGKAVATDFIYEMNFSKEPWFRDALQERFLKSDQLSGTVVEDVYVDPLVQKAYGDEGLTVGFTAPVKDDSGKVIGVWKNFSAWSNVENIVKDAGESLREGGIEFPQVTLLTNTGVVAVDYHPARRGDSVHRDMSEIMKLNLAQANEATAKAAIGGQSGFGSMNGGGNTEAQLCGYDRSHGALGYPGLKWSALVRAPQSEAMAEVRAIRFKVGLITVISTTVMVAIAFGFSIMITRPITAMRDRLKDISEGEGDLTQRVDEKRSDELGELGKWFNVFVAKIQGVISQVAGSATDVAAAATQIAASSEEMSSAVGEVARQAAQASTSASESERIAVEGGELVSGTLAGINSIDHTVKETATSVGQLGGRSEQIGQIVQVINDIADQTNLLALNAAIEAARAGEHGRGFAVVADEVRKLAERTASATKEVSESIQAIQTETAQAVHGMERGTKELAEGVQRANLAGESLSKIVHGTQQVSGMIQAISAASEQAGAGAHQSAEAASQLSQKAEGLQTLVGQFKV